jgi:hypothetical protein
LGLFRIRDFHSFQVRYGYASSNPEVGPSNSQRVKSYRRNGSRVDLRQYHL